MNIKNIRPFVPTKDFDLSIQFYKDLGFKESWKGEDLCLMGSDDYNFFLQDYYIKEFADNFMMQLHVVDLEALYAIALDLTKKYEGAKIKPIFEADYGRTFHLIDPTGVLWHITEAETKEDN